MTYDLKNADMILEQTYFNYRADHIPCSIKKTYTQFGKNDTLVSRELKELNSPEVILGVGYNTSGAPVEIYTCNKKGEKTVLTTEKDILSQTTKSTTKQTIIAERLSSINKHFAEEKSKTQKPNTEEKTTATVTRTSAPQATPRSKEHSL